jgi:hypothetical protein
MPDFNVHAYRWCVTNETFEVDVSGSKGATYTVRYGKTPQGQYQYGWSCTCPGFKFRNSCKHTNEAESKRCAHGHDAVIGSPTPMGDTCPKCDGPTSVISVAV